jgi:hypothetical protein
MSKSITFLLAALLLFNVSSFSQENFVKGELILQLKPGSNVESLKSSFSYLKLEPVQLLSARMKIWLFKYDTNRIEDDEILYTIRENEDVKTVQFNHYVTLREEKNNLYAAPNDPRYNEQWALNNTGQSGGLVDADIDAPEAWNLTTGGLTALGDTIVIAIVDGGCDLNHQDLNYWINYAEIPGNSIDDDGNGYIDDYRGWNAYNNSGNVPSNSHGTHVSGIAAAIGNNLKGVSGVNWYAKVMPVGGSSGTESIVVAAYGYVLEMRARYNETNGAQGAFVVVTNASFGVDYGQPANYPIWCAIYDSLGMQGILNCGATANLNINVDISGDIPTACPSPYMISVTNTTNTDLKNSGAAYGLTTIDLGAPGTSILSTDLNNTYTLKTGTSMATPTVAGAIALMFAGANINIIQAYKNNPSQGALTFRQFLFNGVDTLTALQGKTVTGGRLNVYNSILPISTPPDSIPPLAINDLLVIDTTSSSLILRWTVPLDSTRNGIVAYDIRISTSPINDNTAFSNAQQLTFQGAPDTIGAVENLLVENLAFNTIYYFAIKSSDLWGNISEISNQAVGKTFQAPQISVTPDSIHNDLSPSSVYVDTVFISNISGGPSTLDYQITLANNTFPDDKINLRLLNNLGSNEKYNDDKENPSIIYGNSIEGHGGPDIFGYEWIDSDEPDGPDYVWNDISSSGTAVTTWVATGTFDPKDEGFAGPFSLGFNFKYYGSPVSQIYVSTNGFITFNSLTANNFTNSSLPSASAPNGLIAPFWDDLDGRTQGTVHYKQDGSTFIIQFTNWQKYSGTGSLTFQVILHAGGKILFYYNNMNATLNSATVGIENLSGTDGLMAAYNSTYIKNNLAVKFSAEPDWLSSGTSLGTLYNNNSVGVELTFRTEDFPAGNYSMDLVINSNDPITSSIVVPVTMTNQPIPVELNSLSAEVNKNDVIIKWITASETNNRGFEVERKNIRQIESGKWEPAGFVNGNGNSTMQNLYSFTNSNLLPGKYLYRLKQIDFDGSFEYSNEIEVEVLAPKEYALYQNYPNPFNPATVIEYSIPEKSKVSLVVYSAIGEFIKELVNENQEAGYYKLNFDGSALPSGLYICQFKAEGSGSFLQSKKMLLIK